MKRSLLGLSTAALLVAGLNACAPRPAAQLGTTPEAPKTDIVVQTVEVPRPAEAKPTHADPEAGGKVAPAEALKLILLQWLVAR